MEALGHASRPHAGFEWEDRVAGMLTRKGYTVKQMPRNFKGYDLLVDDKLRIDVKACIHTSYKGSDGYHIRGWVFSNLHNPPTCDLYILVCLNRVRKDVEKMYIIPSNVVMQRTVTITKRDKYMAYKNAWSWVDKMMKKEASIIPVLFQPPRVYRRGEENWDDINPRKDYVAKKNNIGNALVYSALGGMLAFHAENKVTHAIIGAGLGYAIGRNT